jgi:DNA polymerase III epsilon subunit-like protein
MDKSKLGKFHFKPFSKNIVFYDSEFSSLNPYIGEILSIGLVDLKGRELYLELDYKGKADPWVQENIIPTLKSKKYSSTVAIKKIKKFIGDKKPYAVSYVNQFEIVYLHKLFQSKSIKDLPFYWLPIDFASILFGIGFDPKSYYVKDKNNFIDQIGVDKKIFKHTHNALDDARLLREVYLKLFKKYSNEIK